MTIRRLLGGFVGISLEQVVPWSAWPQLLGNEVPEPGYGRELIPNRTRGISRSKSEANGFLRE